MGEKRVGTLLRWKPTCLEKYDNDHRMTCRRTEGGMAELLRVFTSKVGIKIPVCQ
ncbi:Hypothetical protein SMAX5B_018359 [Scophthalmus maximus]|uniref:Uncharacterized protein n=1 Tax=Scophthalmus maximus TaxID=52904 RepID=A0A2U9CAT4_SCOMX|nr:Hypothetical protein SMAX5B_018359 [Scophthalmus maximus]